MGCDISGEQLWSWIDRDAPELDEHVASCPSCRARAQKIREEIGLLESEAKEDIPLPEQIGPYIIKRLLGEGGQALVYEAEQPSPRRSVALKVLKGGYLVDKTRVRHFRREIKTLARLNHPAIATIFEAGRTKEGLHYFAMELVEGNPLHAFVKKERPDRRELVRLFHKICQAVHYAHEHGVVHRDLKPSNVMVDAGGEPKILDFGLARVVHSDTVTGLTVTKDGRVEGTPRYMSPEQALGKQKQIDERSDVYALGVIMYEMLTGKPPSEVNMITPESLRSICEDLPRRPSSVKPDLRGDLDAILLKALEKDRNRRYASVADLAADIARYLEGEPVLAKSASPLYRMRRKLFRRKSRLAVGVPLVAIVALSAWFMNRPTEDTIAARKEMLELKFALLRDGPTPPNYGKATQYARVYPEHPEGTLLMAQAQYLKREQNVAVSSLTGALERDPSIWPYRALLEEIGSRPTGSAPDGQENGGWNGDLAASADAWYLRAFATLDTYRMFDWLRETLDRDPDHALAVAGLKYFIEMVKDEDLTVEASRELVERGYHVRRAVVHGASLLTRQGRYQEALNICDDLIAGYPDDYYGYYIRAKVERRMKRYGEADRSLSLAIEKIPPQNSAKGWLLYHRGTVRLLQDRTVEAIADYQAADERLPHATFADARLFTLLSEAGRRDEAAASLARSRDGRNDDPWLEKVFDALVGQLTPEQLTALAEADGDSIKLCEAYYYAGEIALLNDASADAREWFRKCVATGAENRPGNVLENISEYELAEWRLSRLEIQPAETPPVVLKFRIPEHDLFPENIAYDPVSRNYYLGSLSQSRILVIREDGSYRDFSSSQNVGLLSSVGMKVDAQRRVLWVCSGRFTLLADYDEAPARTGVLAFDLEDGTLIDSWLLDQESDYHIFNDLALASNGDVYATTTLIGRVYKVAAENGEMELVHQLDEGRHNNGIALDRDETHLFLTVDRSIYRLDLANGSLVELDIPDEGALGTDGLYLYGRSLVAVKPRFKQISQIFLNADATASERVVTLAKDHEDFAYPTTGVIVGDKLVFVATSYADVPRNNESAVQHPDVLIYEVSLEAER